MVTLVVFHHVQDYATWKAVFDEHEAARRAHGAVEHRIYQGADDPLRVVVHLDFPDEDAARAFQSDPSLAEAMARAGVVGEPWLGLNEMRDAKRYADGPGPIVFAVHHRVRDFDAWKSVFDRHEDVRRSHGAVGHRIYSPLGDPLMVIVHNDFPTVEAGDAFGADPSLPEAMAEGGVESEPSVNVSLASERVAYA